MLCTRYAPIFCPGDAKEKTKRQVLQKRKNTKTPLRCGHLHCDIYDRVFVETELPYEPASNARPFFFLGKNYTRLSRVVLGRRPLSYPMCVKVRCHHAKVTEPSPTENFERHFFHFSCVFRVVPGYVTRAYHQPCYHMYRNGEVTEQWHFAYFDKTFFCFLVRQRKPRHCASLDPFVESEDRLHKMHRI